MLSGNKPLMMVDEELLQTEFNRNPFRVEHELTGHPLFRIPRLLELCRGLRDDRVEYNGGNLAVNQDAGKTPRTGLSAEETIARIRDCNSWLALKNVEQDPEYRVLLEQMLVPLGSVAKGMHSLEGFIFISSPGSVTPYHMDPEHNFLLQIQGSKLVSLFDRDDRAVVTDEQLETFYGGDEHRNMPYRDEFEERARVFELGPGSGLHFPVTAPHWVKVGPEVSISFSVTFRSEWSRRQSVLHSINRRIRRLGFDPTPVGESRFTDNSKYLVWKAARGVTRRVFPRRR